MPSTGTAAKALHNHLSDDSGPNIDLVKGATWKKYLAKGLKHDTLSTNKENIELTLLAEVLGKQAINQLLLSSYNNVL